MSEDEDRLTRWSRLKTESAATPAPAPVEQPVEPDAEAVEALIAALPKIEDIGATTDIRGFMQPGVPPALRNAALARAWMSDPAIRDRIPDAIDYAEDYNAPHTISGWGAAGRDEIEGFVRRFRDAAPTGEDGARAVAASEPPPAEPEAGLDAQAAETAATVEEGGASPDEADQTAAGEAGPRRRGGARHSSSRHSSSRHGASRHGGALPGNSS